MSNCPNGYVLENIVGKSISATVKGKLIDIGWSASTGYPDGDCDIVHGYLFCSNNLCDNWDFLDEFEDLEFERREVRVERYDEFEVDTYIYTLKAHSEELKEEDIYQSLFFQNNINIS